MHGVREFPDAKRRRSIRHLTGQPLLSRGRTLSLDPLPGRGAPPCGTWLGDPWEILAHLTSRVVK